MSGVGWEHPPPHGLRRVANLPAEARRGFVLLPKRRAIERSFAWATRFHRLVRDYERSPETVKSFHVVAFATLMAHKAIALLASVPNSL